MVNLFGDQVTLRTSRRRSQPRRRRPWSSAFQLELPLCWELPIGASDLDLCLRAQRGSSEAEAEMVRRYERLARFTAKDARVPGLDPSDLVSVALIAIVKAVRTYRSPTIVFERYAKIVIRRDVISESRKAARQIQAHASYDPEELIDVDDILECDRAQSPFRLALLRSDLALLGQMLDERERQVLESLIRTESRTLTAEQLGISTSAVGKAIWSIREKAQQFGQCLN